MRRFLGKSTRIETLALIISIVFVFGSTPVLARGGGHGGGHGHTGGHRGHLVATVLFSLIQPQVRLFVLPGIAGAIITTTS